MLAARYFLAFAGITLAVVVAPAAAPAATTQAEFGAKANRTCGVTAKRADKKILKITNGKRTVDPERNPITAGKAFIVAARAAVPMFRKIRGFDRPAADSTAIGRWIKDSINAYKLLGKGGRALLKRDLKRWDRLSIRSSRLLYRGAGQVDHLPMPRCLAS